MRQRWPAHVLLFLAFTHATPSHGRPSSEQQPLHDAASIEQNAAAAPLTHEVDSQTNVWEHVQPESVREACAILRKIKPATPSKLARFISKPKGIVGTAVYYAKEAFVFLFMNQPATQTPTFTGSDDPTTKLGAPLQKAVTLLEAAAAEDDPDALFLLAEMNFYGNYSHPVDYDHAFHHYLRLAEVDGNATAQYMLGFMYATGLSPANPTDQARAMVYHTFAAESGHTKSQMTLAYRHHAGISTPRNCEEAVHWYKQVAEKAVDYYRSGPPGGHQLNRDAHRIADDVGGVFGEGASVSSAGMNAKQGGPTSDAYADFEDVLEYLHLQSSKGDLKATFGLARLHYDGSRGFRRDFRLAKQYFMEVAREYWTDRAKVKKDIPASTERLAHRAAGYLGRMFLRGEGMEQSFSKAKIWFDRGISGGDALSQYSLGLMYFQGLGLTQDTIKAATYFSAAADQELAVAQTHLGVMFLDQGDAATASKYFELAVQHGHIEAFYYLAEMHNLGIGRERSCSVAAAYYKIVVEKAEAVWSSLHEAVGAYDDDNLRKAFVGYLMAAEQGCEQAQANVAWLLDQSKPRWSPLVWLTAIKSTATAVLTDAALALTHWTRSAKQQNVDSLVKMGDYYLAGIGASASAENAAACYQAAAETQLSAQALWNLGWMHENGVGIEQDFHLAKRFYDQALETNHEAYLPVKLSLFKLRWRSWWNGITHGGVPGIDDGPIDDDFEQGLKKSRTFAEWLNDFLEADAEWWAEHGDEGYETDDWDAQHDHVPRGDEYWDGGQRDIRDDELDDIDDGLLETILIGGLAAALGWLIFYRNQRRQAAERRRREEEQQAGGQHEQAQPPQAPPPLQDQLPPGQQPDGGFFPQPDDPNWQGWVAGGAI